MQYNVAEAANAMQLQCNTMQYNVIQCNTMQPVPPAVPPVVPHIVPADFSRMR